MLCDATGARAVLAQRDATARAAKVPEDCRDAVNVSAGAGRLAVTGALTEESREDRRRDNADASGHPIRRVPPRWRLCAHSQRLPMMRSRQWTHNKARDVGHAQTLAAVASERDVRVAKDVVDELVHRGLLKLAAFARL